MTQTAQFEDRPAQRRSKWLIYLGIGLVSLFVSAPAVRGQQTYGVSARWTVLDFDSAPGDTTSGTTATASVVEELNRLNRYDIAGRPDVLAALQLLGLTPPLSISGERRLGRLLGADTVVTGSVNDITFLGLPQRAQVELTVKIIDVRTGELINGAWVVGESEPRTAPVSDPETLVNEAIDNAAFAAVSQISAYALPHATVLMREDAHTVLLSHGAQDGLRTGVNMVVTRFGDRIGLVRITSTESDQAEARVVQEGGGISAEDVATVIYTLPASPTH